MADGNDPNTNPQLAQAITDALSTAPAAGDVQPSSSPITGSLESPVTPDPTAGMHPGIKAALEFQQQQQQQAQQPPRMGGQPLIYQFARQLFGGPEQRQTGGPMSQPISRGDATLSFLGNFLANMSQGLAAAGHGPGANMRGLAAGIQAPYQRQLGQFEEQQKAQAQQAAIQGEQAKTALTEAQTKAMSNVVQTPYGPMSQALASKIWPAEIAAAGRMGAATITGQSRETVAKIQQGAQVPVDPQIASLVGMPQLANQGVGKGTWDNIKKALDAKGLKLADLGNEGSWIIDRAGNKIRKLADQGPSTARAYEYAKARAEFTPFETVIPGTAIPTTISNMQALQTGQARIPLQTLQKVSGNWALFNDAYGILDKVEQLTSKVNLDDKAVATRVAAGYAAIKDPATSGVGREVLSNALIRQPINNQLSTDERELVLTMAQGKAAGTGLRGIMGQAGTNEMQQRLDSALMPGGQAVGSKQSVIQQVRSTRAMLNRFAPGQLGIGLNAPGTPTALPNQKLPSAPSGGNNEVLKRLEQKYLH